MVQSTLLMLMRCSVLVLVPYCTATCDAGIIYNATTDFGFGSNPNGVWSYHYSNDTLRDGAYELFTEVDPLVGGAAGGSLVWHADPGVATAQRPFAGVNTTSPGVSSWQVNELAIHPGQSGGGGGAGLAILSWTSPFTGTANVDFSLAMGLSGDVLWFFEQNDSTNTLASGSMSGFSDSDAFSLTNISVNIGDRLNFVVDSNGSVGSDLVRLSNATIEANAVPEPSSLLLTLVACPFVLLRRSRNRKSHVEN
ncbi:MAG: PEP-CTERM sorting domain-containing protein [Planctomycetota bacterium]